MSLFTTTTRIENSDAFHLSRLLLLINTFAGREPENAVEGITKLAKLDFLLRYPAYLERALRARQVKAGTAEVRNYEATDVESTMVRFKYGPWDFRYRRFINLLVAKGLAHVYVHGRTVHIGITAKGKEIASELAEQPEFTELLMRTRLLKSHLDLSATTLMKFIYSTFPEISDLRYGQQIDEL
jgi:hypothetical protein